MMNFDRLYRSAVLGVAANDAVKRVVTERAWSVARRFVAGEALSDALDAMQTLGADGVGGILDLLGEMVDDAAAADAFTRRILEIFPALEARDLRGYVSVKLSQLGLDVDAALATANARRILERARAANAFVRIDMEDHPRVDATLDAYRALRGEGFDNVGIVLQSALYRSERDLEDLAPLRPNVRVVKGAYNEPPDVAYPDKHAVDMVYRRLVYRNLELGHHTAVATHDESIIDDVKRFVAASRVPREQFEFQMLYGIRRDLQRALAAEGFTVRAYIPYGRDWYAYFSRRIAERPANVAFVLRGLIRG